MGEAGHKPLYDLDKCLESGNLAGAWYAAVGAAVIYLDQFLLITLLLAEDESATYEAAARKFLVRFMREVKPPLEQVKVVADALCVVGDAGAFPPERGAAKSAMTDLARQLRERRRP